MVVTIGIKSQSFLGMAGGVTTDFPITSYTPTQTPYHNWYNLYGLYQYTPPEYTPQTPPLLYTPSYTLTCHTTLSTEQPFYAIETGADRVELHQSEVSSDSVSEFPPTPTHVSTHISTHVSTAPLMFDESPERVRKVVSLPVATGEVRSGNDVIVASESCDEDEGFGLFTEAEESVKEVENDGGEENRDTTVGYEPWNRE